MVLKLFAGTKFCKNVRRFQKNLKILIDFNTSLASSNSIKILMETKFYRRTDILLKISSVNRISIEQENRFFTNKLISWKLSFLIVRAFSVSKPKILQIYDKIMKHCLNIIRSILAGSFEGDIPENHETTDVSTFLSICFFLSKPQQFIYFRGKEILCWFNFAKELCRENFYFSKYGLLKDCYLH